MSLQTFNTTVKVHLTVFQKIEKVLNENINRPNHEVYLESNDLFKTLENTRKKTIKLFNKIGFKITIDIGTTTSNFLDETLNLTDDDTNHTVRKNQLLNQQKIEPPNNY